MRLLNACRKIDEYEFVGKSAKAPAGQICRRVCVHHLGFIAAFRANERLATRPPLLRSSECSMKHEVRHLGRRRPPLGQTRGTSQRTKEQHELNNSRFPVIKDVSVSLNDSPNWYTMFSARTIALWKSSNGCQRFESFYSNRIEMYG
jgi:hypothetical protein